MAGWLPLMPLRCALAGLLVFTDTARIYFIVLFHSRRLLYRKGERSSSASRRARGTVEERRRLGLLARSVGDIDSVCCSIEDGDHHPTRDDVRQLQHAAAGQESEEPGENVEEEAAGGGLLGRRRGARVAAQVSE